MYIYTQWSGVLELILSRTKKARTVQEYMETTSYIHWNFFSSFPSVSAVARWWLKFGLKHSKKEDGANKQKKTNSFPSTQPPLFVCMITTKTLLKWFQICFFEEYLVLSQQNWCSYVGIKEQHHKTNPLNVAELHLGPPYNYILVWQTKTLNSKSTKNTSHESTKNTSHLSLSGNIKEGQWTILGSHRGLKCTKSEEF